MGYGLACLIVYLIQFVLPTTVAVAQLHFHYVEYSAMCNVWEVQTGVLELRNVLFIRLSDFLSQSVRLCHQVSQT